MPVSEHHRKSCTPQHLSEMPSQSWGVERLVEYARLQHDEILKREKSLAPCYWRLGHALSLARKNFDHGQWSQYLASLGIHKTRASRARTIYEAFVTVDEVKDMSVEDAYEARRHRLQGHQSVQVDVEAVRVVKFIKALAKIERGAAQVLDCGLQMTRAEKEELRKNLCQTIACLQEQLTRLEDELEAEAEKLPLTWL